MQGLTVMLLFQNKANLVIENLLQLVDTQN